MPKTNKSQPRWNWRRSRPDIPFKTIFPDAVQRRLLRSVGAKSEQHREVFISSLRNATIDYWTQKQLAAEPGRAEILAAFDALRTHTLPLIRMLQQLDRRSKGLLVFEIVELQATRERQKGTPENVREIRAYLRDAIQLLGNTAKNLREINLAIRLAGRLLGRAKAGRKRNDALIGFVTTIGTSYTEITRESPRAGLTYDPKSREYVGPFLTLMTECLQRLDPEARISNNALGEIIRRGFGGRSR